MYNVRSGAIRRQTPDLLSDGNSNVCIFQLLLVKIALHTNHPWLLAMSDRHNGRGAEPTSRQEIALLLENRGSYMLDADTDGNPDFATRAYTARPRHRRARDCQYTTNG